MVIAITTMSRLPTNPSQFYRGSFAGLSRVYYNITAGHSPSLCRERRGGSYDKTACIVSPTSLPKVSTNKNKEPEEKSSGSKSGGYLLSHNKCSTIGVAELNDPVRNGKGWDLSAITTSIIGLRWITFTLFSLFS